MRIGLYKSKITTAGTAKKILTYSGMYETLRVKLGGKFTVPPLKLFL